MEFMYAAELKKRFSCYGHFYEWVAMGGERANCRSVLEIVDPSIPQENPSGISLMEPDAVVVMMNPGSSHPKDIYHIDGEIEYPQNSGSMRKELVLTQPDNTQYQVMRIAVSKGWKHIRVLNLSDLRDPKSGSFIQKTEALCEIMGGHTHSLFCKERTAERIKIEVGSAHESSENLTTEMRGVDQVTGLPKVVEVTTEEIRESMWEKIEMILKAVRYTLEETPPELAADIIDQGIVLCGGGALLRDLDLLIYKDTGIVTKVADDPLSSVVLGTMRILEDFDRYKNLLARGK